MKPLLVIEHEPSSPMGSIADWIQSRNIHWQHVRLFEGEELPPVTSISRAIILGGDMNVDEEDQYPFLRREKKWLTQALKQQLPLMGICLGAQLLAEVMGARVYRLPFWEIGWINVFADRQKQNKEGRFFSWHAYGFDIPVGAQACFFGEHWWAQGFRSEKVLAFQFHPEAKKEFIEDCMQSFETQAFHSVTRQTADQIRQEAAESLTQSKEWFFSRCDQWAHI